MRVILEREQWAACSEATTGPQALALALELKPDLVVLDVAGSIPALGTKITIAEFRLAPCALSDCLHRSGGVGQAARIVVSFFSAPGDAVRYLAADSTI